MTSILLSGVSVTLPSTLALKTLLCSALEFSNIGLASDRPFTDWGILRLLLRNATVIQICRWLSSCEPVCNVRRISYPIPFIRFVTLLYLSNTTCCECAKTMTFFFYHSLDYLIVSNMVHHNEAHPCFCLCRWPESLADYCNW